MFSSSSSNSNRKTCQHQQQPWILLQTSSGDLFLLEWGESANIDFCVKREITSCKFTLESFELQHFWVVLGSSLTLASNIPEKTWWYFHWNCFPRKDFTLSVIHVIKIPTDKYCIYCTPRIQKMEKHRLISLGLKFTGKLFTYYCDEVWKGCIT